MKKQKKSLNLRRKKIKNNALGENPRWSVFFSWFMITITLAQYIATPSLLAETVEEKLFPRQNTEDAFERQVPQRRERAPVSPRVVDPMAGKQTKDIGMGKIPYKDPRLSCLLSLIIPGGGEFYLRRDVKGVMFCISTTTVYLLSFYYLYLGFTSGTKSNLWTGVVGTVLGGILHVVGMVESYNDAVEINEARYYFSE